MVKNIVFDMGNVLLRFDREEFLDAAGVAKEDREILLRRVFLSTDWVKLDWGTHDEAEAVERMCLGLPARLHPAVHQLVECWDEPIRPMAGMEALVRELKDKGYSLYLLSNASRRQHAYWPRVPGQDCFAGTVISADLGVIKPDAAIYEALYKKFSLKPEECLFIDDSPYNIEGGIRTGMDGIVFYGDVPALRAELKARSIL